MSELRMILDIKLNFQEHLKNTLNEVNKTIGLLQKLQNFLPYTNRLSDLILIMVMLYMINRIINLSTKKRTQYNIMLLQL